MNNGESMSVYDFIEMTRRQKYDWINYCEILINRSGGVILARPSHVESAIAYVCNSRNISRDELRKDIPIECLPLEWIVDRYGCIAVWYSQYIYGKHINRLQRKTLGLLIEHNLIKKDSKKIETKEYRNFLTRKKILEELTK